MKRDGVRFDAEGFPCLTKRQTERVHRYVIEIVRNGSTKIVVSQWELTCALFELAMHTKAMHVRLEQFMVGALTAVPARVVARTAVALLNKLKSLPDDDARDQFMQMLLGDDEEDAPTDAPPPTSGRAH